MSPPNRSEIMSIEDTDPAEGAAQEPPLRDEPGQRPLAGRRTLHEGMVFDLVRDTVDFADGVRFDREYIWHTGARSEEHTSELQSRGHLVCRLLLEKKKQRDEGYERR